MSYVHYGKFADVWKHLSLCSVLEIQRPLRYIESNSAFPWYILSRTPEQDHGIFTFLDRAHATGLLKDTPYYRLEHRAHEHRQGPVYLGSPALALNILKRSTKEFTFFDIDEQALESIRQYSQSNFPHLSVNCENQDSIAGIRNLLPLLTPKDFIFFDPYQPFLPGKDGGNYIQLFHDANLKEIPSMLWYGFDSMDEKKTFDEKISYQFARGQGGRILNAFVYLKAIHEREKIKRPGVFGCGMLCSNLSNDSVEEINGLILDLSSNYRGIFLYDQYSGELEANAHFHGPDE